MNQPILNELSLTVESVERVAREALVLPLQEGDAATISQILRSLAGELRAMRRFDSGEREPASTFDSSVA